MQARQCAAPFLLVAICFGQAAAQELPKKVTGQVLDPTGKPLRNVQIVLKRTRQGQEPPDWPDLAEPEDPDGSNVLPPDLHGELAQLGRGTTDAMGHFSIRPVLKEPTHGPLVLTADHRDYVMREGVVSNANDLTITLRPIEIVALAWRIRDEQDPERAEQMAAEMLQGDEKKIWWISYTGRIYPHIGSIRSSLLRVATSGKWEKPVIEGRPSPGHRARMLLAYWADERDEKIVKQWWKGIESRKRSFSFPDEFQPKAEPAENLDEAITNWRKYVGKEDIGFTSTRGEAPSRAFVQFFAFIEPDAPAYKWHIVFVKRDGKWRPLFHHRS